MAAYAANFASEALGADGPDASLIVNRDFTRPVRAATTVVLSGEQV
jgi:hypothetical protein